jgi:hypothetical protein
MTLLPLSGKRDASVLEVSMALLVILLAAECWTVILPGIVAYYDKAVLSVKTFELLDV